MRSMPWKFLLSAIFIITAVSSCHADGLTMEKFESESVVPDVLNQVPKQKLTVSYGSTTVNTGDTLTPSATKTQPKLEFQAEQGSLYTVCMVDPDAPSRENPKFGEWLHWLIVNVPMNQLDKGKVLTEYRGPTPPKGSGFHRYVLLVFKQPGEISEENLPDSLVSAVSSRKKFNVKQLTQSLKLDDPVFGNFFLAVNN